MIMECDKQQWLKLLNKIEEVKIMRKDGTILYSELIEELDKKVFGKSLTFPRRVVAYRRYRRNNKSE